MKIDWLDAHYHFSFASYHDPDRMGLGTLRVINDDIVKVGGGFDFHPHRDMEIITYVRSGAITHKDSLGNHGITRAGEVQIMSAGTGITHAEFNDEPVDTTLYQIWITPRTRGLTPRWEQRQFPEKSTDGLHLLVSGLEEHRATDALKIDQNAALWGGHITPTHPITQPLKGAAYLLVSDGEVRLGDSMLQKGDGAILLGEPEITLTTTTHSEVVLIDLPTLR
jgi:redox-sensitive bicupin YhaK (pirin superfamily)